MQKELAYYIKTALIIFLMVTHSANAKLSIFNESTGYAGEYHDSESGLQYLRARYYLPEEMRFISRDSFDLGNRYNYVDGDPINKRDPSGHMGENIVAKLGHEVTNLFSEIVNKNFQLPADVVKEMGHEHAGEAAALNILEPEEEIMELMITYSYELPALDNNALLSEEDEPVSNHEDTYTFHYQIHTLDEDDVNEINDEGEVNMSPFAYHEAITKFNENNFEELTFIAPNKLRKIRFKFIPDTDHYEDYKMYEIHINTENEITQVHSLNQEQEDLGNNQPNQQN